MTTPRRILFFADCGAEIGGGHVMRSLTWAQALTARGAICAFAAPQDARAILATYGSSEIQVLPTAGGDPDAALAEVQEAALAWKADWIVVDHYRLDRRHETALRYPYRRIAVIDDLAERSRDADLLLDPSYGRTAADYQGLIPPSARVRTGPDYALVRPQFAAARTLALGRRGASPVRRLLVSLGLTDVGGITGRVIAALSPHLGDIAVDIALGRDAPSLSRLRALADPRVTLHVETQQMADLMTEADLAIGAGGSSTWERCCLGLPTLTLVLAPNQAPLAAAFARDGISPAVDAANLNMALIPAWRALLDDAALRARLSAGGARLCDGLGAGRAADALLQA